MTPCDHYQHNVNKQGRVHFHTFILLCFNVALMYDFVYHVYPAYLPTFDNDDIIVIKMSCSFIVHLHDAFFRRIHWKSIGELD